MSATKPVHRRLVCYLSGFDPQGPAHYHQLYATEATKQAAVGGYRVTVGRRRKLSDAVASWPVTAVWGDTTVETRYDFLRWDDIVRAHWPRSRWGLLKATLFASRQMWCNGVMWHSWRRSWPMFSAIAAPGVLMVLLATLAMALLGAAGVLAANGNGVAGGVAVLVGLPALAGLGLLAEARTHMAWLMRSLACLVRQARGQTPELDERLRALARHVTTEWQAGAYDEVLIVGHSSGAMLAQIVAAQVLRDGAVDPVRQGQLSLLTLGHCAPLLSEQPEATSYREDLAELCRSAHLCWVEISAPPDGCCFALVDPTERLRLPPTARRPLLLNPRFANLFEPATYRVVRQDKFRCHFQYVMASERAGNYDYFALTAGPQTLPARVRTEAGIKDFRQFTCFGGPPAP